MHNQINKHHNTRSFTRQLRACVVAIIFGLLSTAAMANFVDTKGTSIVDEHGQTLFLKGINLGNWLLWEGYLMMGDYQYRTHTQLFNSLTTVFGSEAKTREFEHQWRLHYVDEQALKALRQLGFNSVRVPFHYRLFWQDGQLTDRGFEYFDRLIQSAGKHGIYVLLDMHAAPGYQNPGDHADNLQSNASQPRDSVGFWDNGENIKIAAKVWRHIALRYKDEPIIWGYDLLNEPVPQHGRELELLSSLITLRNAIREVDTQHIIVAQGSWWGSDLTKLDWTEPKVQQASGVTEQWDNKLVYQLHHYGPAADTIGREAITNKLNVPLIIGEYGESNNANIAKITVWAKQDLAGYFAWSFKKMSHDKTLWTIPPNSAYQQLKHHINTAQPGSDDLYQAMLHFAQSNIKNGHPALQWHGDFYQAINPSLTGE